MKSWNLLTGYPARLSRVSAMTLLIYSNALSANDPIPSVDFLEFLAQEENEQWMEVILETTEETLSKQSTEPQKIRMGGNNEAN